MHLIQIYLLNKKNGIKHFDLISIIPLPLSLKISTINLSFIFLSKCEKTVSLFAYMMTAYLLLFHKKTKRWKTSKYTKKMETNIS